MNKLLVVYHVVEIQWYDYCLFEIQNLEANGNYLWNLVVSFFKVFKICLVQVLLPFSADFLLFFLTLFYFNFRLIVLNKVFSSYSWTWLVPINDTSLTPVDSRTSWGHWKPVSTNHRPGERPWSRSCPGGRSRSSLTRQRSKHVGQTLQTRLRRWVKNPEKRERQRTVSEQFLRWTWNQKIGSSLRGLLVTVMVGQLSVYCTLWLFGFFWFFHDISILFLTYIKMI